VSDHVLEYVLDSTDATVGGGSAAALAGAMAAGLAGMVARLSMGRGLGLSDERYLAVADETDELGRDLHAGARQDAEAYGLIKDAYGLPRDGDAALARRKAAIERALEGAAAVPLDNARRSLRVRELCALLTGSSNPAAGSDLAAATLLADAAVRGCLLNVDVNTAQLPDSPAAARLRREAQAVAAGNGRACGSAKETT
jgi:formiminotetrahydrofolate cyclodeaminase